MTNSWNQRIIIKTHKHTAESLIPYEMKISPRIERKITVQQIVYEICNISESRSRNDGVLGNPVAADG